MVTEIKIEFIRNQQHWANKFIFLLILAVFPILSASGQQFNSDNYLTMPHGTETVVLTTGSRNAGFATSFALLPNFEFFAQGFLFWEDESFQKPQHFNLLLYAKYQFWENAAKNGGGGVFLGLGKTPGYWQQTELIQTHRNIWTAVPITLPLFNNTISWDIMPGLTYDWSNAEGRGDAWGFTYSTRVAIYKVIPKTAIVGEIFGTEGDLYSQPEYKVGLRFEASETVVPAISYGGNINGDRGGGRLEIGVMIFSPRFLKIGPNKQQDEISS